MKKRKKINLFVYAIANGEKRHFFVLSIKMQKGVDLNGEKENNRTHYQRSCV